MSRRDDLLRADALRQRDEDRVDRLRQRLNEGATAATLFVLRVADGRAVDSDRRWTVEPAVKADAALQRCDDGVGLERRSRRARIRVVIVGVAGQVEAVIDAPEVTDSELPKLLSDCEIALGLKKLESPAGSCLEREPEKETTWTRGIFRRTR